MGRRGWRGWRLLPPTDSSLWGAAEVLRRLAVAVVAVLGKRRHRRMSDPMEVMRRRPSMIVSIADGRRAAFEGRGGAGGGRVSVLTSKAAQGVRCATLG